MVHTGLGLDGVTSSFFPGFEESKFEEVSFDIRNVIILLYDVDTKNLLLELIIGID
jgi:hypothetical protein